MNRRAILRAATLTLLTAATTVAAVTCAGPAYAAQLQIRAIYTLPQIITNITTWVVGLLIGVATLFLTIGGLRYMASGGDPMEAEKAKGAIRSALIGYALAVLAPMLLGIVKTWIGAP